MEARCKVVVRLTSLFALFFWLFVGSAMAQGSDDAQLSATEKSTKNTFFPRSIPLRPTLILIISVAERPLTVASIPNQLAQANAPFKLDLKPYFSVIKPEVTYLVRNNAPDTTLMVGVGRFVTGDNLSRVYQGEGVCTSDLFTLTPNQSCLLRYVADESRYHAIVKGGPVVRFKMQDPYDMARTLVAQIHGPTQALVSPASQNGLYYDPATMSILGMPTKPGLYHFQISATDGYVSAASVNLDIDVSINPIDTPVFKKKQLIASAMPTKGYQLDLMTLLEHKESFQTTNQVSFRIDTEHYYPSWLSIESNDPMILKGQAPARDIGKTKEITLIASSNSGGDSLPLTITIPVTYDLEKRPSIGQSIKLEGSAGNKFQHDLLEKITDPASDNHLQLIIDKIEPAAPWLSVSSIKHTELTGDVPVNAVGQNYKLLVHANNSIGGDSDFEILDLQIAIDEKLTPNFYLDNPILPMLYEKQPFIYDFVAHNDVIPEYVKAPYFVELAAHANNPTWLRIDDNKLLINSVPANLGPMVTLWVTIRNIPGGKSKALPVTLYINKQDVS